MELTYCVSWENPMLRDRITFWNFEPLGSGTKFTYALEYQLPVPLLGSLIDSLLMKRQWDKIIVNSLDNLKHHFAASSGTVPR